MSGAACIRSAPRAAARRAVAHESSPSSSSPSLLGYRQQGGVGVQDARAVDRGDVELDVADLDAVADRRRAAELAEDDAADRVVILVRELAVEALVELLDRQAALDAVAIRPEAHDRGVLGIELVVDLADDLLEQILERDEAGDRAVLVDDDRHVALLAPDLGQQVAEALRLGHEVRRIEQARADRCSRRRRSGAPRTAGARAARRARCRTPRRTPDSACRGAGAPAPSPPAA